jgi:hypothetical protein
MMKKLVALGALAVLVFVASPIARTPNAPAFPDAPAAIQTLIRQALEDRFRALDIPDLDLRYGRNRTVEIRREIRLDKARLTNDAQPHVDGFTFTLRTTAELQAEANLHPEHLGPLFVMVESANISEATHTASIELGTDALVPAGSKILKFCCCWGPGYFRQSQDIWTLSSWGTITCS